MSYLIRKINKAKWFQVDIINNDDVSADAVTNCLKTSENTLSVWFIPDISQIDSAVLALISNQEHLETIDVVKLEKNKIEELKLEIAETPGKTPIITYVGMHRNLEKLTFSKLGFLKNYIVECIRKGEIMRYTRGQLKKIIGEAIEQGLMKKEDLNEMLREKI